VLDGVVGVGGELLGVDLRVGGGELLQGVLEPPAGPGRGGHPGGDSVARLRWVRLGMRLSCVAPW